MQRQYLTDFNKAIKAIKSAILQSRYRAAKLANREMLSLYFGIGKFISENSRDHFWGTGAIENISERLQQELPELRGFSPVNIKRMRLFYEEWQQYLLPENPTQTIRPLSTDDIQIDLLVINRPSLTDDFDKLNWECFLSIGFTHHYEILVKTKSLPERLFYIDKCASEFWSVEKLKYSLKENLFSKQGKQPNNFAITISDADLRRKALLAFKGEYLSALDDLVRLSHENRSIGIILCKSKKEKIVEYAFRDTSKPMGVSTYKLTTDLPEKYREILPSEEELRKLM